MGGWELTALPRHHSWICGDGRRLRIEGEGKGRGEGEMGGEVGEGREGGRDGAMGRRARNGSGPDQVREEIDTPATLCRFYRAMHFSTKRGIAIACRLSLCPSVTLVNNIVIGLGWNSSKIISQLVSLGRSLFATPT